MAHITANNSPLGSAPIPIQAGTVPATRITTDAAMAPSQTGSHPPSALDKALALGPLRGETVTGMGPQPPHPAGCSPPSRTETSASRKAPSWEWVALGEEPLPQVKTWLQAWGKWAAGPQKNPVPAFGWDADLQATLQVVLLDDFANFNVPTRAASLCLGGPAPLGVLAVRHWLCRQSAPDAPAPDAQVLNAVQTFLGRYSLNEDCAKTHLSVALAALNPDADALQNWYATLSPPLPINALATARLALLLPQLRHPTPSWTFKKTADVAFLLMGPLLKRHLATSGWAAGESHMLCKLVRHGPAHGELQQFEWRLRHKRVNCLLLSAVDAAAYGPKDLMAQFKLWARREGILASQLLQGGDFDEFAAFYYAVQDGDANIVKLLVDWAKEEGLAVNRMLWADRFQAFFCAAKNGHVDTLRLLINLGQQQFLFDHVGQKYRLVDVMLEFDDFAIFRKTAAGGHIEALTVLLEFAKQRQLDGTMLQAYDFGAFCWAAEAGHIGVAKRLLGEIKERGFNVGAILRFNRFSTFSRPADAEHTEVLQFLVEVAEENGIAVKDILEAENFAAFKGAASRGRIDTARFLIKLANNNGVDVRRMLQSILDDCFSLARGNAVATEFVYELAKQYQCSIPYRWSRP